MKTYFQLAITVALISGTAHADWIEIGKGSDGIYYVDPQSIRRNGNFAKMWYLTNYPAPVQVGRITFSSAKYQSEYDCYEETERGRSHLAYSGYMGEGTLVYSNADEKKWTPLPPGSIGLTLWKIACAKR